ncbi:hypothetical protein K440DRAFT_389839 [Wilcoxina mikolae CBS 423.85]|nr:hypothetical protein K440DRAFT_389839 [Wilcoxina mikolae CBS 423.85]
MTSVTFSSLSSIKLTLLKCRKRLHRPAGGQERREVQGAKALPTGGVDESDVTSTLPEDISGFEGGSRGATGGVVQGIFRIVEGDELFLVCEDEGPAKGGFWGECRTGGPGAEVVDGVQRGQARRRGARWRWRVGGDNPSGIARREARRGHNTANREASKRRPTQDIHTELGGFFLA